MPINSGYSFYEYAGDGVTTRFPVQFSLGELKRAYVTCRVDNEVDAFGAPLYRELADVPGDPGMIEVLGAVPGVGVPIVFRRIVPKELLLHLYANGSILDYPSLDESHLQLMMALHEVLDGYGLTNVFTDINMNGYKLTNVFSDPDDPDSIATVAFLGTYRQDALDAAVAAADSALKALGYRNAAQVLANNSAASANNSAASALLAAGSATDAAQSAQEAQDAADSIGVMQSRGVLLTGQDTITLTWTYNPTLKNVAVYLDGVKQDADTALVYTDANTITLTEPVTEATNWEVISVTLAGDSVLSGYVDQAQTIVNNAALSNLPVGALIWVTGVNAPAGFIVGDGELRSRAAFPDLWAFAQASGNISVDDASWTFGQYSPGDGSTTFRVPKVDDRFIRGKSATRAVGLVEEDAFQGHWHGESGGATAPGAYITTAGGGTVRTAILGTTGATTITPVYISDGTNGTPRTADETRPKALTMLPCIKAYDVISDPNVLNAVEVVNEISRLESEKLAKTDIVAPGDAPMFACRAWVNFDGTTTPPTIRASGNVSSVVRNAAGDYTVNFESPMPDANFAVAISTNASSSEGVGVSAKASGYHTVSSVRVVNGNLSGSKIDPLYFNVAVFR